MIRSNAVLAAVLFLAGVGSVAAQDKTSVPGEAALPVAATAGRPAEAKGVLVPLGGMRAEWEFFKSRGKNVDKNVAAAILPELSDWLKLYPDSEYAPEAQFLKADIDLRLGEYKFAIVDLLKLTQEYPVSGFNASANKLLSETIDRKMDKKIKSVLIEIGKTPVTGGKAERLAALLIKLEERAGEELYAPITEEFREFFGRFPEYAGRDELQLTLGNLHSKNEEYLPARLAFEKLVTVYPDSRFLLKAKESLGGVLADHLKEYNGAISVYQDIAAIYPGTDEALKAYGQLVKLSERQEKYGLTVEICEKIISLYPDKDITYDAFLTEARILREELSKPAEAVAVLGRLADKYKGAQAIEALYLAAKIARKDLKDPVMEQKMYDRIFTEYPEDPEAPKALFASAEVYENALSFEKAREYYKKVSEKYPDNPLSAKALKRLNSIAGK